MVEKTSRLKKIEQDTDMIESNLSRMKADLAKKSQEGGKSQERSRSFGKGKQDESSPKFGSWHQSYSKQFSYDAKKNCCR